ncbi:MAG: hypothetical protein E7426_02245 [Ruminococcaceae bacterium]|nr:hypothetical protein [Oscillospiraceae bacterium]
MRKPFKRLFALLLSMVMLLGLLPTVAFAADAGSAGRANAAHVFTKAENAVLDNDVFAKISAIQSDAARPMGGVAQMTENDYISILPAVIDAIESSDTYVEGTLQQNGNFLVWETTTGIPCCYDPRMEAELHNTVNDPSPAEIAATQAEADALLAELQDTAVLNGGSPSSIEIGLIQPYWESSSSYADSSFTSYSPYYKTMWQNLCSATGGSSSYRYSMSNATVDNIAKAMEKCGLVIFDSHGTTDYSGSNGDYTSRANCSYLCLTSNSGITSADTAAQTGTYGTYYNCLKGSGYAYVSGTCIANHMTSNAPHSLLYMGICLGMATDGMYKGLRSKGVEAVYGYSQSVSFKGEKVYMQAILGYLKNGDDFATALSKAKSANGSWDPAYSSYSLSQAKSNKVAFPIVVSSEDAYPGHGNVDAVQTVYSTWSLFGAATSYTVTATSNNTSYGTVSVSGNTITASPKTGYYASGYKVTSGSATVTQSGNTFTVTPASDCTVQIIFSAKSTVSVTCMAAGSVYTTVSGYAGDTLTLPSSATTVDGWNFLGWTSAAVTETSNKPSYYAPGASITPSTNTTVYALYARNEDGGSATGFTLLTSAPSDWSGNYVITYGNTAGSMYVLKGLSGNTRYESTSAGGATAFASTGMSLSNSTLTDVSSAYIFNIASYNSKYSIRNASTGTYLGSYSSYLYSRSSLSSSYCCWTLAMNGSAMKASNSASSRYPYLSFSSSKYFMINSSASSSIYFWKEGSVGTTYYTTSPTTTTHTHSYGAWTSNNNGTHSHACSTCGEVETENCTYTDVVTSPTATEQGYTTHTCSVCGYSYKDSYTPALGSDYLVSFSVPADVAAVPSMSCNSNGSIILPTADAPDGYMFLGWVVNDYNNVTIAPGAILTGAYTATANITLKALYSHTEGTGGVGYELVTSSPSSWAGSYVITYRNTAGSMYVLKGLSGNTRYESTSAGGATAFASTGMSLSNEVLTNVSDDYVFNIAAATSSKYTIRNAATGTYLGSYSSYLYSRSSLSSTYCRWTLAMNGSAVKATNSASSRYPYLSFSSSKYFMINSSVSSSIYFWKLTDTGATYYTTIIG